MFDLAVLTSFAKLHHLADGPRRSRQTKARTCALGRRASASRNLHLATAAGILSNGSSGMEVGTEAGIVCEGLYHSCDDGARHSASSTLLNEGGILEEGFVELRWKGLLCSD